MLAAQDPKTGNLVALHPRGLVHLFDWSVVPVPFDAEISMFGRLPAFKLKGQSSFVMDARKVRCCPIS